jgi:hypothetical protein
MTTATNGVLRIVNATAWVRETLERVHLLEFMTSGTRSQASGDTPC